MGRWDRLLDQKPQELKDFVLDRIADALAHDLRAWPLPIEEWLDPAAQARFAAVVARPDKPSLDVLRVSLGLAREELLREVERIDRYCRSPGFRAQLPEPLDRDTVHFVTRYVVDAALAFQEHGKGKFRRADLVTLVEKLEERLLRGYRLRL